MNCKKCGSLVEEKSKFCPYCGEKIEQENQPTKILYQEDTNKIKSSKKIEYLDDCDSIGNKIYSKDYRSLTGLIVSILAVPFLFIHVGLGLVMTIIGLILVIVGFKHTTKGLRITSLIFSILSFVIVLLFSIFIAIGSITITLNDGTRTTIKEYFEGAFWNGFHTDKVEGDWYSQENELFSLYSDGTYYLYMDADDQDKQYFAGNYVIDSGYSIGSDTVFSDENYYYYTMTTSNLQVSDDTEDENTEYISKLLSSNIILKIEKENFQTIIFNFPRYNVEIQMSREGVADMLSFLFVIQ